MEQRLVAWSAAAEAVKPIVEQHGLEPYGAGGNIFAPTTRFTKVDQHIDHIMRVADWLLEPIQTQE